VEARWYELQAEAASLVKAFPYLGRLTGTRKSKGAKSAPEESGTQKRKRSKMSAAQKKAVSARMKKYWAQRRAKKS
jgi:hypothetical protein